MQTHEELYNVLKSNKEAIKEGRPEKLKIVVVSIAPQSRASIAAMYNLSPLQVRTYYKYKFTNINLRPHHIINRSIR